MPCSQGAHVIIVSYIGHVGAVIIFCYVQVLSHPHLVANGYGHINVPFNIRKVFEV